MGAGAVRLGLYIVAVIVAVALVASFWNRLTAWLPWSTQSQLNRANQTAATATVDNKVKDAQLGQEREIHVRELETIREKPVIILRTERAAEATRNAPDQRAATELFFSGVCDTPIYSDQPECIEEGNASNG